MNLGKRDFVYNGSGFYIYSGLRYRVLAMLDAMTEQSQEGLVVFDSRTETNVPVKDYMVLNEDEKRQKFERLLRGFTTYATTHNEDDVEKYTELFILRATEIFIQQSNEILGEL